MDERGPIVRQIALGGGRRVLLFAHAATNRKRAENLVCVDASQRIIWSAKLPVSSGPDHFVSVDREEGSLIVRTLSGLSLVISAGTGLVLD
jgi:hypothetical protein